MAIVLVLHQEFDETHNRYHIVTSHGVDTRTGNAVVLPPESPDKIGEWSETYGEWILRDD